jgi:hypothetical protein
VQLTEPLGATVALRSQLKTFANFVSYLSSILGRFCETNGYEYTCRAKAGISVRAQFDVIIDGKRRSVRSVWMTCTEMGVMFAEASQKHADLVERERDIASLIQLLKMAEEKWPSSESYEISETEMLGRDQALLDVWPEACRRMRTAANQ